MLTVFIRSQKFCSGKISLIHPAEYLSAQVVALQALGSALVLSKNKERGFSSFTNFPILCFSARILSLGSHWVVSLSVRPLL